MDLSPYQQPERILEALHQKRIAVVGMSGNELRASNFVGFYLERHGYEVIPVNPREEAIYGNMSYPTLTDIPGEVDVVDVFRAPEAVPEIAREAAAIGAKFLWLQFGVISEEGIHIAEAAGVKPIVDRCMKIEHARYYGRMHWLGFNRGTISARRPPG
ncbi:MAG: CoA-binding protein [Gammaproteobacteria bacterium]|jgi:predicted CoA-binding protein